MDAKDLRTEAALCDRSKDGPSKYPHIGVLPCGNNKSYQDISSNPLAKLDIPTTRPCAVIGPDRVLPPSIVGDAYMKKSQYDTWPSTDNTYRHPPEYPHKMTNYPSPLRNISPRQTFQENMQRIMVAPTYNTVNIGEDNFTIDRNTALTKNSKSMGSVEPKYCDVPYSVNTVSDNQKNTEMCASNVNNIRNCPPMWHPSGVNIRPVRPYGATELYQYPEYASCAVPRSAPLSRPQNTINESPSHQYSDTYYHQGNIRFRPYPNIKDRYPQSRYDYINNYPNPFNPPPPFPTHKFDLQKSLPHPAYPQVPIKYLENRINESVIDGFQRNPQQVNYNLPYQNQMIYPAYGPMISNSLQNKLYPYQSESSVKSIPSNKVPFDNNKLYLEYENGRNKSYENFYVNEMARPHMKNQVIIPNYPTMNMQSIPPHAYYRKLNHSNKNYEYAPHLRHADPSIITNNHLTRFTSEFSPIAISPSESNTSIDNLHSQGSFEDCGYFSQSSTTSIRSIDSNVNRVLSGDVYRRYNYPLPHIMRSSPTTPKSHLNLDNIPNTKDKKGIDIRQFLEMWNEGDEGSSGNTKEIISQIDYIKDTNKVTQRELKNQEQLYVLGSVNVPSEELGKYEHIQKISKLPDNIKGCNNVELLKHFEEVIESSNLNSFNNRKLSSPRNFQPLKPILTPGSVIPTRPLSPLDVEAKISQSVIHKEVGCNFEIKPCSPEMLNVEAATPIQNLLGERVIEKVSNPYQSPISGILSSDISCDESQQNHLTNNNKISSCKLINTQCSDSVNSIKDNYSLQDLESNSGVCLASLPRLDNDIELSFPEVNQQFINANKESVIITKEIHNETKETMLDNIVKETKNNNAIALTCEPEKEFPKLSKYRKNKKSENEIRETNLIRSSQVIRTDSVIIKNPDNIRSMEEAECLVHNNIDKIHNESKMQTLSNIFESNTEHKMNNTNEEPSEIAIDFSMNKTHNLSISQNLLEANEETDSQINIEKSNDANVMTKHSDLLKSNVYNKDETEYEEEVLTQTADQSINELNVNCPKTIMEINNFTQEIIPDTPTHINTNNNTLELNQNETQLCMLSSENDESHTSTEYNKNKNENIKDVYIAESEVQDEVSSQNIFSKNENTANPYSEPMLCESTIVNEKNVNSPSLQDKFEIETKINHNIMEHIIDSEKTQHEEISVHENYNTVSKSSENCTFTTNLSNNELVNSEVVSKIGRCNIKKELFSPWIQKLIWCNEDTDFSITRPTNTIVTNANNDSLLCNSSNCELLSISTENKHDLDELNETLSNTDDSCRNENTNLLTLDLKDNIMDSTDNLCGDEKRKETSFSTDEPSCIQTPEPVVKGDYIIEIDETNHMLVNDESHDRISKTQTENIGEVIKIEVTASDLHRTTLKRSLSDSALINISEDTDHESSIWSKKRRKNNGYHKICDPSLFPATLSIQNNRRNSMSSTYNENNLSFCIVIDNNCIITQENEEDDKSNSAELSGDCLTETNNSLENEIEVDATTDIIFCPQEDCEYPEPFVLDISDEQSWVDDIGCVETVVSDEVVEDINVSTQSSPKSEDSSEHDESDIFSSASDHTEKVKYIYGDKMCNDDAELVETLYRTPQMNVNKTLTYRESHESDDIGELNVHINSDLLQSDDSVSKSIKVDLHNSVDRNFYNDSDTEIPRQEQLTETVTKVLQDNSEENKNAISTLEVKETEDDTVNSCESSLDSVFLYNLEGDPSSPEVSSTTSEEKNSTILLKITNYKGMRKSQLNDTYIENNNINSRNSCKFTESKNYTNCDNSSKPRPLITKAAQKYIPPAKEPFDDLKVKLPLPQHSLLKFKQLKISKTVPKHINTIKQEISKKPKPKFEDVLKSIDEIQVKMHKERNKKNKKPVPKVVIKKNEKGAHYTSPSDKHYFNPDLTGRKWQPWVFIEKSYFIDKMATKNKTKAIFNHRKNTYVIADKFQKYKSVSSAKFIISQPKLDNPSIGQLKYTIRLKHNY